MPQEQCGAPGFSLPNRWTLSHALSHPQASSGPHTFCALPPLRWQVPCKLRLVVLAGALRARVAASPSSAKAVVFFSNCDSVEFYHAGEHSVEKTLQLGVSERGFYRCTGKLASACVGLLNSSSSAGLGWLGRTCCPDGGAQHSWGSGAWLLGAEPPAWHSNSPSPPPPTSCAHPPCSAGGTVGGGYWGAPAAQWRAHPQAARQPHPGLVWVCEGLVRRQLCGCCAVATLP